MPLDIVQMYDDMHEHTGTDTFDLPDAKILVALNRAYWEIIDKFQFREKEVLVTFNASPGTRLYNMPEPFEALRRLAVVDPDTNEHKPLKRTTTDYYEENFDSDPEEQGIPTHYVREGCAARVWPTPDKAYEFVLRYYTVLSDLNSGNNVPQIPQAWHEIVFFGGLWRIQLALGDYTRSNEIRRHQASLINSMVPVEAKEEMDSQKSGGIRIVRREYDV